MTGPFSCPQVLPPRTDYGDAPQSYDGTAAAGHAIANDLRIGATVDGESNPQWSTNADGDDQTVAGGNTTYYVATGGAVVSSGFVNNPGNAEGAPDGTPTGAIGSGDALTFTMQSTIPAGTPFTIYVRGNNTGFGTATLSATGATLTPSFFTVNSTSIVTRTFTADAPLTSFTVTRTSGGPRIDAVGATVTVAPSSDDEDGVDVSAMIIADAGSYYGATLEVPVTNDTNSDAQLVCWADFAQNGTFNQTDERSLANFVAHTLVKEGAPQDYWATSFYDPNAASNPVANPQNALGDPRSGDSVANIRAGEVLVLEIGAAIQNGDSFDVHLLGNNLGGGTGTLQICTGSTGTGCAATIPITEAQTIVSVAARTYTANATGRYLKITRSTGQIRVDGVLYNRASAGQSCTQTGITDATFTTGNVPAGCHGAATVQWTGIPARPQQGQLLYARCRLTTDASFFSDASPTPTGAAIDGEIEDHAGTPPPTAVTIGEVGLEPESVDAFLAELGVADLDSDALLALLDGWSSEAAAALSGANRAAILAALTDHLDPDGDGQVAVLRWDTLEERGTIGFYVERRVSGDTEWRVVNDDLLPGLVTAPLGGVYLLADPEAESGVTYEYQLIEQEATGSTRHYGPFTVEMQ